MSETRSNAPHICLSPDCGCGLTRRDFLRMSALATAGVAAPFLRAGDAVAQTQRSDDVPVRIGYLPITDATPLLVAHARKLFEAEGLTTERPRLFRSWAQIVEAFVAGQVNVIHLLSPSTLWVRYGTKFPAKVVAWNHMNGSGIAVANNINTVSDLGGKTVAIPFWYSIHNILLQQLLVANGLKPVTRSRGGIAADEVNLVVQAPAEMVPALASGAIAGYIVAEPFIAAAEVNGVGKALRFSGDVWKDHACCVTFLSERDIEQRPEWAQRVTNAIVKAQVWAKGNLLDTATILSNAGSERYTPHAPNVLAKVFSTADYAEYEKSGVVRNKGWHQRRIDFQPYPFPSYTEELVRLLRDKTYVEGDASFLKTLDPAFVARDLVDDRFVRKAIDELGGPSAFGISADFTRREVIVT